MTSVQSASPYTISPATGGHGLAEYFGPPDVLSTRVDGRVAETCNVYNMLKLTRLLFAGSPELKYRFPRRTPPATLARSLAASAAQS